jgi:hypothetical protein
MEEGRRKEEEGRKEDRKEWRKEGNKVWLNGGAHLLAHHA